MKSDRVATVVLMGAESTGKTTLAASLAKHYNTGWTPEYLRLFVDRKGSLPDEEDVYAIAEGHLDQVASLRSEAHKVLFIDTDLFTTCVYQRIYFSKCPPSVEHAAKRHQSGLYLFTQPDIPWVPDPGQRASPEERLRSHALLIAEAEIQVLNIVPIHGNQDERLTVAIQSVDRYLAMD